MNIGIFTDTYFPQINGVVTSARMLEKELTRLGHRVFIFTTTDPRVKSIQPNVFRLPSMPLIFLKTHRLAFYYPPRLILRAQRFKLDIVHTYSEFPLGFFGKLLSKIYRIPMVHTYHTMYEDYVHYVANGHLITPGGAQKYSRLFCNRADIVIAPAEKTRNYLTSIGVKKPVRMIPSGLDFSQFDPTRFTLEELYAARRGLGLSPSDRVVVTVGRVAKEKSIHVLVDMMPALLARVPNAKLLIVGDGPEREALQDRAGQLGMTDAIVFAGFRPWEEIARYYRLSDAFATASTSETQGLTYIEAMASCVPVVVKKDPSFDAIIAHGDTGFIFARDEDAADTVADALLDREKTARVAMRGYAAIQPLSAEVFARRVVDVYREVIESQKKPK